MYFLSSLAFGRGKSRSLAYGQQGSLRCPLLVKSNKKKQKTKKKGWNKKKTQIRKKKMVMFKRIA